MNYDAKFLSLANLVLQVVLAVFLSYAVFLAKKKELKKHCNLVRFAVTIQIAAILTIMLPPMADYIENPDLNIEILLHHVTGLLVIGLWIYINLVYARKIPWPVHFRLIMKIVYILWILALIAGTHLYIRIYS